MNLIIFNGQTDYFQGVFPALYIINSGLFMLKIFINLKEVAHFIENMLWQVVYVLILVIRRVVKGYGYYLFIVAVAVYHCDYPDRIGAHKA